MTVFCRLRKYPTRTARYASDMLEFYRPTVPDGLDMVCLVPTIPTGRSLPKGCMLMVKNTDFGEIIIRMGKWLREGTTRTAKRWAIGSFGVAMALQKKARTTLFQTGDVSGLSQGEHKAGEWPLQSFVSQWLPSPLPAFHEIGVASSQSCRRDVPNNPH